MIQNHSFFKNAQLLMLSLNVSSFLAAIQAVVLIVMDSVNLPGFNSFFIIFCTNLTIKNFFLLINTKLTNI
jgi:hypothetical protein